MGETFADGRSIVLNSIVQGAVQPVHLDHWGGALCCCRRSLSQIVLGVFKDISAVLVL